MMMFVSWDSGASINQASRCNLFYNLCLEVVGFLVCEEVGLKRRGMIADPVIVLQSFAVSFHKTLWADRAGPVVLS